MRSLVLLVLWALPAFALEAPAYLGPKPPAKVRRVVTLAPSLTETVLALGAGDTLVGVSRFDELPQVALLPRVGGFVDPSIEAVVAQKPELVLVEPNAGNRAPVERMAALGIPVLALPMQSLAELRASLREVGRALGRIQPSEALLEELEASRARVRKLGEGKKPLRVLYVVEFSPLVVAGPKAFASELLADAGALNVAGQAPGAYAVYSVEAVLRARPEVVIDASHDSRGAEVLKALPGLSSARWVRLPSRDLIHPGPHLGRGLETLFPLLHGELRR